MAPSPQPKEAIVCHPLPSACPEWTNAARASSQLRVGDSSPYPHESFAPQRRAWSKTDVFGNDNTACRRSSCGPLPSGH